MDGSPVGIRMAVGACRRHALGQVSVLVVLGVGLGLVVALPLSRTGSGMLYKMTGTVPVTYVAIALLLAATALLASILPARAATRVATMVALRVE